ncbi:hypothetical protein [Actinomyces procaprae]|uniref:hypothetical protein n=1 Tax=Actinomyces procaprae TaxID=2560010 RepID=UPI0010A2937A|nr:hypothetical protein [Actinomyces procaprae]
MSIYQPAFALTDALIDEAARRGFALRGPNFFGGDGRFSVTLHADGAVASRLDGMGFRLRWHYESSGTVCAVHGRKFEDVTGRRWQVDVIRTVGPLSMYGHLLDDDEDEEAAA